MNGRQNALTRRDFLRMAGISAAGLYVAGTGKASAAPETPSDSTVSGGMSEGGKKLIWGELLHLGNNMWGDTPRAYTPPVDHFICDIPLWNELTEKMAESGQNLIVIDLGEAVRYESHPELAIEGAWTVDRLREELVRLRKLGLEPIPKLNFSTCHDFWLGEYARMVSTPKYYEVCADLVKEVSEIFDRPRFFHLGYDEETYGNQETYDYVVVRQGELWWHDFLFFADTVEKEGVRPWIWADAYWHHPEEFLEKMPRSVLLSNWYYASEMNPNDWGVKAYADLNEAGFDQIPTGSNWSNDVNFQKTVEYCRERIDPEHLLGFLQAPWFPTTPEFREKHLKAIEQVKNAMF